MAKLFDWCEEWDIRRGISQWENAAVNSSHQVAVSTIPHAALCYYSTTEKILIVLYVRQIS